MQAPHLQCCHSQPDNWQRQISPPPPTLFVVSDRHPRMKKTGATTDLLWVSAVPERRWRILFQRDLRYKAVQAVQDIAPHARWQLFPPLSSDRGGTAIPSSRSTKIVMPEKRRASFTGCNQCGQPGHIAPPPSHSLSLFGSPSFPFLPSFLACFLFCFHRWEAVTGSSISPWSSSSSYFAALLGMRNIFLFFILWI